MNKRNKKFICFLTVRTGSSRLPNKPLLKIQGKMVIEHAIDRIKLVKKADGIVLCTSTDPSDDILEEVALKQGIKVFRGSLNDLPTRWLGAATKYDVDYFLKVDGADDIFCDFELIDLAIEQMKEKPCDCLEIPDSLVCGGSARCISVEALKRACEIKGDEEAEDLTPFFMNRKLFKIRDIKVKDPIFHNPNIRLTMDYEEDLQFFRRVFDELSMDKNNLPLKNILEFLNKKPELIKINFSRHDDYLKNRENKISSASKKIKNHEAQE